MRSIGSASRLGGRCVDSPTSVTTWCTFPTTSARRRAGRLLCPQRDVLLARDIADTTVYTAAYLGLKWASFGFVVGLVAMVLLLGVSFLLAFGGFLVMLVSALAIEGRWHRRLVDQHLLHLPAQAASDWDKGMAALDTLLAESGWQRHAITVVLSGHYARHLVVPVEPGLSEAEQQALAQTLFQETFGELARDWVLSARLNNAFDKRYETVFGYNQPGREGFVSVRWSPR